MIKSIIKETFIVLILCLIIVGILSILFYDYNPISKVVPNKVKYTTPSSLDEELDETTIEDLTEAGSRVYTIEGSDLSIYKKSKTYDPSKDNPFVDTKNEEEQNEITNTTDSSTSQTNTTGTVTKKK